MSVQTKYCSKNKTIQNEEWETALRNHNSWLSYIQNMLNRQTYLFRKNILPSKIKIKNKYL